jgi:hypothetical protein
MSPCRQLEAGVRFLLRSQDRDGAWRDFQLRPGRSDAWTTAFIATRLISAVHGTLRQPVLRALLGAAEFLQGAREPHGGWAYNRRCPTDADSTACAILFLNAVSAPVHPKDYAALGRFQLSAGGFATYRFGGSGHAWCTAHPEVTATALRALAQYLSPDHFRVSTGLDWLSKQLAEEGTRSPYWWLSQHYFMIEAERLRHVFPALPVCGEPKPGQFGGCFDLALRLEGANLRQSVGPAREIFARLLMLQQSDGGWPSSPVLRIPDAGRQTGEEHHAADDRRLLTTATAIAALRTSCRPQRAKRRERQPTAASSPPE